MLCLFSFCLSSVSCCGLRCGAECGTAPVDLLNSKFAAGVTYLDLLPTVAGDYKLCLGETQVAALSVLPAQCVFNHQDMSPCSEEVCTMYGFEDERCQKYVTEYAVMGGHTAGYLPERRIDLFVSQQQCT